MKLIYEIKQLRIYTFCDIWKIWTGLKNWTGLKFLNLQNIGTTTYITECNNETTSFKFNEIHLHTDNKCSRRLKMKDIKQWYVHEIQYNYIL